MISLELMRKLAQRTPSKIILFVLDGLGSWVPHPDTGQTELEAANLPHFDELAAQSMGGLITMVGPGITPGSGPGHLALFGYDPMQYDIGRGILSALGVGFPVTPQDVAVRANFCTLDSEGRVSDRRAGRVSTEQAQQICRRLQGIHVDGVETFVQVEREYRVLVVFRGEGLSDRVTDSDPQQTGVPPRRVEPLEPDAQHTADVVNKFLGLVHQKLQKEPRANGLLLRGFAKHPQLPLFSEVYQVRAAAIAVYPMYKGLGRLVGMDVLDGAENFAQEVALLKDNYDRYDFFYLHYKPADSAGEDGDFQRKARMLEEADRLLPEVVGLNPDVLAVTGDHSTPSAMAAHSWHPVPFMLRSRWIAPDGFERFTERALSRGSLGRFPALEVMPLLMAHALKLTKYGA
ncbi:MAG: 2,3-bisphosphoglycerate-independent phosphoglycerate mutase [Chloroflexi bacterium]|nr:2,3-bisphosphoglycerate-independent phosphoglycerate mutase [Chloroflexota bacterium]